MYNIIFLENIYEEGVHMELFIPNSNMVTQDMEDFFKLSRQPATNAHPDSIARIYLSK